MVADLKWRDLGNWLKFHPCSRVLDAECVENAFGALVIMLAETKLKARRRHVSAFRKEHENKLPMKAISPSGERAIRSGDVLRGLVWVAPLRVALA